MNWKCPQCNEEVDEPLDSCWQCGTGRDGTPPPDDFAVEMNSNAGDREPDHTEPEPALLDPVAELSRRFKCVKCEHREAHVERIVTQGAGLYEFIGVSCKNCGYTEFYHPDLIEGRNITDILFGP